MRAQVRGLEGYMEDASQNSIPEEGKTDTASRAVPPRTRWVSDEQAAAIRMVDHFKNSEYRQLNLNQVLDEYVADFVEPLQRLVGSPRAVADIGTGYGWLALAFALCTEARITAVEYDARRMAAAQRIADILGVGHRIEWLNASIASLPIPDRAMDAVYCIEVIEHTGVDPAYVAELCRISNDVLVITTPNKVFPVIRHDTELPFCHWLPSRMRDVYAAACGRSARQENNLFWSPSSLLASVRDFKRESRFMQFSSYADYRKTRALRGPRSGLGGRCLDAYFGLAARLGRYSMYALPNLASTFRRRA
jgi:ubiquinone/menaquinone biosynthesis C-methylase UbiE